MAGWQVVRQFFEQYWLGTLLGILALIFSILGFIGRGEISKFYREKISPRLHRLYETIKSKIPKRGDEMTKEELKQIVNELRGINENLGDILKLKKEFEELKGTVLNETEGVRKDIADKIENIKEDIIIDVRSINSIAFHLHNIPVVTIYFTITNMSQYLTLTLDRLIFELWLKSEHGTEPLFHKAHCLEREEIKIKEKKDIFCELDLNNPQIQKLEKVKEEKEPPTANITVTAYFNSKLYGEVEIKKHLEYIPCKIQ